MNENQLAKNIMEYRKRKGLSQEKVTEYLGVSRQAVTKWESAVSKPSSDNLIKLAELFEISIEDLLHQSSQKEENSKSDLLISKASWIYVFFSMACLIAYLLISVSKDNFEFGTFICMFIIVLPIQLFIHLYFFYAIKNDSFEGIAGFDDKIEYNIEEVKKLLNKIDLHIQMSSTVFVFLFSMMNLQELGSRGLKACLILFYLFEFCVVILYNNYKVIDKIYRKEEDKKRSHAGILITMSYLLNLFAGISITFFIFYSKGIENNSLEALKIGGLLMAGILIATIGYILEDHQIKKWDPSEKKIKHSAFARCSLILSAIFYGLICII